MIHAFPMHGYHKMLAEGYRTRDAHILEWASNLTSPTSPIYVHSRPEPIPLRRLTLRKSPGRPTLNNVVDRYRSVLRVPPLKDRKRWWVASASMYRPLPDEGALIAWNPMIGLRDDISHRTGRSLHVDLLDDWLVHAAFQGFHKKVEIAYKRLFDNATTVTANSEGTLKLAQDHGRSDAVLLPNGCDPERFSGTSRASGKVKVGYVGKIGTRLDVQLIAASCKSNPGLDFVFAGPVLDRHVGHALASIPNLTMLGDIHYSEVPSLLSDFDLGWVPHGVEFGQVGGDAIKIYEYRAAGLPVLTTPIIGTRERPMPGVTVLDAEAHDSYFREVNIVNGRVERQHMSIPVELTWKFKTQKILAMMKVDLNDE